MPATTTIPALLHPPRVRRVIAAVVVVAALVLWMPRLITEVPAGRALEHGACADGETSGCTTTLSVPVEVVGTVGYKNKGLRWDAAGVEPFTISGLWGHSEPRGLVDGQVTDLVTYRGRVLAFDAGQGRRELRTTAYRGALRAGLGILGAVTIGLALAVPTSRAGRRRAGRTAGLVVVALVLGDTLAAVGVSLTSVVASTVIALGVALTVGSLWHAGPGDTATS